MQCNSCGHIKIFEVGCGIRLCPDCSHKIARRNAKKYMPYVKTFKKPALLTLTTIRQKRLNFKEIRRQFSMFRKYYTKMITAAGLYCFETKQKEDGWHTHIHAIVDSAFYFQNAISEEWKKATGGESYIVDIRRVKTLSALRYMLKYLSKSTELLNQNGAEEYLKASKNQRMIQTFGKKYGFLCAKPEPLECEKCHAVDWNFFVDTNFCECDIQYVET